MPSRLALLRLGASPKSPSYHCPLKSDIASVSRKEFFHIQAITERIFTLNGDKT